MLCYLFIFVGIEQLTSHTRDSLLDKLLLCWISLGGLISFSEVHELLTKIQKFKTNAF